LPLPAGSSRYSRARCPSSAEASDVGPRGLDLSFRALMRLAGTPRNPRRIERCGFLLSWHCPLSPPRCSILRASTPGRSEEQPLGRRYHPTTSCSACVVSHHLDGFLRAVTAGLLRPAASLEVRRVFPVSQLVSPESDPAVEPGPRDTVHTLRRVSLISSRTASLQPFPSYRFTSTTSPGPGPPVPNLND
jgi:hypothetical protein